MRRRNRRRLIARIHAAAALCKLPPSAWVRLPRAEKKRLKAEARS